jgi:hypothetical protein
MAFGSLFGINKLLGFFNLPISSTDMGLGSMQLVGVCGNGTTPFDQFW